jgi:hypothetical protein
MLGEHLARAESPARIEQLEEQDARRSAGGRAGHPRGEHSRHVATGRVRACSHAAELTKVRSLA